MCTLQVKVGIFAAMLVNACQIDDKPPPGREPNQVRYSLDGAQVPVEQGLSFAVLDETKHLMGPNTHIWFEAGELSDGGDSVLGDKLEINIPRGMGTGAQRPRYTMLPPRSEAWVSYRHSADTRWQAYDGTLTIERTDTRLRARFDNLTLGNACGDRRVLQDGFIDVAVGAEDVFPASDVDEEVGSEWAQLDATDELEDAAIVTLDGTTYACDSSDMFQDTLSAEESGTGNVEHTLYTAAICICDSNQAANGAPTSFAVVTELPMNGSGNLVGQGLPYEAFLVVDTKHTPDDVTDDDTWLSFDDLYLNYHAVGTTPGDPTDIEITRSLTFYFVDQSGGGFSLDMSKSRTVAYAHMYGVLASP